METFQRSVDDDSIFASLYTIDVFQQNQVLYFELVLFV